MEPAPAAATTAAEKDVLQQLNMLLLSARSADALRDLAQFYAAQLDGLGQADFGNMCYSPSALIHHLRDTIPDPHAQPARIFLLEQMPLTTVGKASRIELRRRAAEIAVQDALSGLGDPVGATIRSGSDGTLTVQFLDKDTPDPARRAVAALGLAESGPVAG